MKVYPCAICEEYFLTINSLKIHNLSQKHLRKCKFNKIYQNEVNETTEIFLSKLGNKLNDEMILLEK